MEAQDDDNFDVGSRVRKVFKQNKLSEIRQIEHETRLAAETRGRDIRIAVGYGGGGDVMMSRKRYRDVLGTYEAVDNLTAFTGDLKESVLRVEVNDDVVLGLFQNCVTHLTDESSSLLKKHDENVRRNDAIYSTAQDTYVVVSAPERAYNCLEHNDVLGAALSIITARSVYHRYKSSGDGGKTTNLNVILDTQLKLLDPVVPLVVAKCRSLLLNSASACVTLAAYLVGADVVAMCSEWCEVVVTDLVNTASNQQSDIIAVTVNTMTKYISALLCLSRSFCAERCVTRCTYDAVGRSGADNVMATANLLALLGLSTTRGKDPDNLEHSRTFQSTEMNEPPSTDMMTKIVRDVVCAAKPRIIHALCERMAQSMIPIDVMITKLFVALSNVTGDLNIPSLSLSSGPCEHYLVMTNKLAPLDDNVQSYSFISGSPSPYDDNIAVLLTEYFDDWSREQTNRLSFSVFVLPMSVLQQSSSAAPDWSSSEALGPGVGDLRLSPLIPITRTFVSKYDVSVLKEIVFRLFGTLSVSTCQPGGLPEWLISPASSTLCTAFGLFQTNAVHLISSSVARLTSSLSLATKALSEVLVNKSQSMAMKTILHKSFADNLTNSCNGIVDQLYSFASRCTELVDQSVPMALFIYNISLSLSNPLIAPGLLYAMSSVYDADYNGYVTLCNRLRDIASHVLTCTVEYVVKQACIELWDVLGSLNYKLGSGVRPSIDPALRSFMYYLVKQVDQMPISCRSMIREQLNTSMESVVIKCWNSAISTNVETTAALVLYVNVAYLAAMTSARWPVQSDVIRNIDPVDWACYEGPIKQLISEEQSRTCLMAHHLMVDFKPPKSAPTGPSDAGSDVSMLNAADRSVAEQYLRDNASSMQMSAHLLASVQ